MLSSRILVLTVLLAVVVLLNLPLPASMQIKAAARDSVAPFQNVMSLVLYKGLNLFRFFANPRGGLSEREQMLTELAELKFKLNNMKLLEADNAKLRSMVGFSDRQERGLLLAEVVARCDASGWWQTVTINRGSEAGVTEGAAVITTEGLVGRIREVARRTSTVLLITDYGCRVACRVSGSGALGIAKGTGVSIGGERPLEMLSSVQPLSMDYVSKDIPLARDDVVTTSGLGGVFPEGLIVGYVKGVELDRSGLYQRAQVLPAADLAVLRYVFVVATS